MNEIMTNHEPVERTFPGDIRVKYQTTAHHVARYEFAAKIRDAKGSALDLACGYGYGTEILRQAGYRTIGIDIDFLTIQEAIKKYPLNKFIDIPIQKFDFFTYDLITFFEGIEHLKYYDGIMTILKASKSLEKGGRFLISIPKDSNPIYNKFHLSAWNYDLFTSILTVLFDKVEIYGQDWDTATIDKVNPENNDFFIAVCSNL